VHEFLASQEAPVRIAGSGLIDAGRKIRSQFLRDTSLRRKFETLPIIDRQEAKGGLTKRQGFLQDCFEHRRNMAPRAVDHPQNFSGRELRSLRCVALIGAFV
jgi:hypothetical protein